MYISNPPPTSPCENLDSYVTTPLICYCSLLFCSMNKTLLICGVFSDTASKLHNFDTVSKLLNFEAPESGDFSYREPKYKAVFQPFFRIPTTDIYGPHPLKLGR